MKNALMFDYEYNRVWHNNHKNNTCRYADKNSDKLYPYCQIISRSCLFEYPLPNICGELKKYTKNKNNKKVNPIKSLPSKLT